MRLVASGLVAVVGLVWSVHVLVTYGQVGVGEGQKEQPMQEKSIEAVLTEHTSTLMALPGVVGTAQGSCSGKPCIKVYVAEKTPELLKQIPSSLEGYPVEVQETGEIRALDSS